MDTELKCNRLTCRRVLTDKAVVTTCSHIFCVECATELFNASRLCPACETSLLEPDDVVVRMRLRGVRFTIFRGERLDMFPSPIERLQNILSGLSPMIILEICSRQVKVLFFPKVDINMSSIPGPSPSGNIKYNRKGSNIRGDRTTSYLMRAKTTLVTCSVFQQAVLRNVSDKNAQLQKQLDNVIREANGEIGLLNSKIAELERDLEIERRKNRELQDASRERDKEYQKLKVAHDKFKRKALFPMGTENTHAHGVNASINVPSIADQAVIINKLGRPNANKPLDVGAVVGGMEANGIQRTPLVNRAVLPGPNAPGNSWASQPQRNAFRPVFPGIATDRSHRPGYVSDCSDSTNEVENILTQHPQVRHASTPTSVNNWQIAAQRTRMPRPRNGKDTCYGCIPH